MYIYIYIAHRIITIVSNYINRYIYIDIDGYMVGIGILYTHITHTETYRI